MNREPREPREKKEAKWDLPRPNLFTHRVKKSLSNSLCSFASLAFFAVSIPGFGLMKLENE
jgi:hypothetical protein